MGSEALAIGSEVLAIGSEALTIGSEALTIGSKAGADTYQGGMNNLYFLWVLSFISCFFLIKSTKIASVPCS